MGTHLGKYYTGFIASKGIKDFKWILMLSQSARVRDFKLNLQLEIRICHKLFNVWKENFGDRSILF